MTRSLRLPGALIAIVGSMLGATTYAGEEKPADIGMSSSFFLDKVATLGEPLDVPPPIERRFLLPPNTGQVLKFLDRASEGTVWETDSSCQLSEKGHERGLCRLRWRKNDIFSTLKGRYADASYGLKARFVGDRLADHLEVDLDSSPEIKFKWEID